MIRLDFTKAETFRKLADLPYYGWAEALVRRVDPLWKVSPDYPIIFKVIVERGNEGCDICGGQCCGNEGDYERKTVKVEAYDTDSACEAAERQLAKETGLDWCSASATPMVCSANVPDEFMRWFDDAETVQ